MLLTAFAEDLLRVDQVPSPTRRIEQKRTPPIAICWKFRARVIERQLTDILQKEQKSRTLDGGKEYKGHIEILALACTTEIGMNNMMIHIQDTDRAMQN